MKEEEMKVWKMKDLGLQTLKLISSASNQVRLFAVPVVVVVVVAVVICPNLVFMYVQYVCMTAFFW